MAKVLITGGTGLVGKHLSQKLIDKGYDIAFLSRSKNSIKSIPTYVWDYKTGDIELEAFDNVDYIIHLAGANIGEKRWSERRKKILIDSRVSTGELLLKTIADNDIKIKAFITASGIGYYGAETTENIYTEKDNPSSDFIGKICVSWEKVADKFESIGIRSLKIRTGIVLTKNKGALEKIIKPVKFKIGAILGKGNQYLPWIHIDDLCNIYIKAIKDNKMSGEYNAVAPNHLIYKDLIKLSGNVIGKPFIYINIPSFIIRLIFGEMSAILLKGSRISADKIIKAGLNFKFTEIEKALKDLN